MDEKEVYRRFSGLQPFLPEGAFEKVIVYFKAYPIQLKITKDRKTIKGDYRHPFRDKPLHRISINGTLNPYSFLIILLHEIAHLLTFVKYKNKVLPHGREWKDYFRLVLSDFLDGRFFPSDIEKALVKSLGNMAATTCADPDLDKALRRYDKKDKSLQYLEEIPFDAHFEMGDGRVFQKIEKLRTRYRCKELKSGRLYYVMALAEVRILK